MRHRKSFNHLGRKSQHRKAMLSNMASSLILHKRINTTLAKAKALRTYVEPLITKAKEDTTHSRRVVFSYLQDKNAVTELFREVSAKVADRPGGYTRIIKMGNRLGDNADMALIELVDYNEHMLSESKGTKSKSTRRSRGGGKKKADTKKTTAEAPKAETKVEKQPVKEEKKEAAAGKPTAEAGKEEVMEAPTTEAKVEKEPAKEEKKEAAESKPAAEAKKEEVKEEPKAEKKSEDKASKETGEEETPEK